MGRKTTSDGPLTGKEAREARLKAALKANLGRRKAQTRARGAAEEEKTVSEPGDTGNDKAG